MKMITNRRNQAKFVLLYKFSFGYIASECRTSVQSCGATQSAMSAAEGTTYNANSRTFCICMIPIPERHNTELLRSTKALALTTDEKSSTDGSDG